MSGMQYKVSQVHPFLGCPTSRGFRDVGSRDRAIQGSLDGVSEASWCITVRSCADHGTVDWRNLVSFHSTRPQAVLRQWRFTLSCLQLLPASPASGHGKAARFVTACRGTSAWTLPFFMLGFVVMLEHVHLLLSESDRETLSVAMQALKQVGGIVSAHVSKSARRGAPQ